MKIRPRSCSLLGRPLVYGGLFLVVLIGWPDGTSEGLPGESPIGRSPESSWVRSI
jgi:hypothetical protein